MIIFSPQSNSREGITFFSLSPSISPLTPQPLSPHRWSLSFLLYQICSCFSSYLPYAVLVSFPLSSKRPLNPVDSFSWISPSIFSLLYIFSASKFLSGSNSPRVMCHLDVIFSPQKADVPLCCLLDEGQTPWHTIQGPLYTFSCLVMDPLFCHLLCFVL